MKKAFLAFIFTAALFIDLAFGCFPGPNPIKKFDDTEYIFSGKVIGYTPTVDFTTTAIPSKKVTRKNVGLIIKIEERVYIPQTPEKYFEVFDYNTDSDCSPLGIDKDVMERKFPLNSEVRVIAKAASLLSGSLANGNIRLEICPNDRGSISLNNQNYIDSVRRASKGFDYQSLKNLKYPDSLVADYEMRRDLFRLENSSSPEERSKILERLLYFPRYYLFPRLDFRSLAKAYVAGEAEYNRLEAEINRLDEIYFKAHLSKKQFKKYMQDKRARNVK